MSADSGAVTHSFDRVHARVVAAGHRSQKAPEDAFWGARYAIFEDLDGNAVGIMSPIDESMRRPPPPPPHTRAIRAGRIEHLRFSSRQPVGLADDAGV